jgi:thymidylate kinase
MAQRAPFIVIEGLDRSGKTTQTGKLYETLKDIGVEAKLIKFPGEPEHCHFVRLTLPHVSHSICMILFLSLI